MTPLKVVLDTNALLRSLSRRSPFSVILDRLYEGDFELWVTNDILLEYEEKISDIFSKETAAGNVHYLVTNDKHFNEVENLVLA